MKALTIHQPWASLIVHGLKPYEWRAWPCPRFMVGQRVVIHAGAVNPLKGIRHLLMRDDHIVASCGPGVDVRAIRAVLERAATNPTLVPLRAGLGIATLGEPMLADQVYHRQGLKIGGEGPWNWGWPVTDIERWDQPVPAKGAQGFWNWSEAI